MTGVLVVGDVINDVIVRPAGPAATDTDTMAAIASVPGGSGGNQAAWLAALGVPVRLAARVGAGDADAQRQLLVEAGVDPRLSVDPELPTGSIVVVVGEGGTRSMYTDRGANARLGNLGVDLLAGVGHLHVSGYALIEPGSRAAVASLWQAAGQSGLTRSVDAASAAFMGEIGPAFLDWTEGADIVFANLAEGNVITGTDEADGNDVATRLVQSYPVVVLKLGSSGAIVATPSERVACPPADGAVVDPTGAGDAFCAGFLSRWLGGAALHEACAAARQAAAGAMATVGARSPAPAPPAAPAGSEMATAASTPEAAARGGASTGPPWGRLRQAARVASASAHAPYSGLRVGAAGVTDRERVLTGCNVENASFGLGLCAECGLVSALRAAGSDRLVAISVVAQDGMPLAPCGRCRQVLWDNGGPDMLIDRGPGTDPIRLGDLLPGAFGPDELARRTAP